MAQTSEPGHEVQEAEAASFVHAKQDPPRAVRASYVATSGQLLIELSTGYGIVVAPQALQGLEDASPAALSVIEISPSGLGLHFPLIDADIYLPALLAGVFGSQAWMAAQLGRKGGQARSAAKSASSRENGRRGGRPKRRPVELPDAT